MKTPYSLITLLSVLVLGGCGEFAYKTGAGADALAADREACRQAGGDLKACMHDKGWSITDLSGDDPPTPSTAQASPTSAIIPAPATQSPPGASPVPQTGSAVPVTPAPAAVDPTAPVKMTAWVKFGGGGPQDDIDACVAKLGPADAPDSVHHTVTRALLACMREKGWRGL
jgi:hypothetical protein